METKNVLRHFFMNHCWQPITDTVLSA